MFIFPVCGEKRCCWVPGMGWHGWRGWARWWRGGGEARTGCSGQKDFQLNLLCIDKTDSRTKTLGCCWAFVMSPYFYTAVLHSMFCIVQKKNLFYGKCSIFTGNSRHCLEIARLSISIVHQKKMWRIFPNQYFINIAIDILENLFIIAIFKEVSFNV